MLDQQIYLYYAKKDAKQRLEYQFHRSCSLL